tara:strand:- start:317 stop:616 length:300 start_codon:yes stop_codon:yes gene_type:complete
MPGTSVLILAVCLLTVLPRSTRLLFLGSARISSTTTTGKLESDIEAIASSKFGTGASGSENSPDTSHNSTKAAKIEATLKLLLIILDLLDLYTHQGTDL